MLRHRKSGFTLVELLVVIAIIAMLVTLLLPAVQSAREAARRSQCQNNLKNLALACLNYESASQKMPPSYTPGAIGTPSYESWPIGILPFVEEQALHDRYNFDLPNDCSSSDAECANSNGFVREQFLEIHICPSDVGTDQLVKPESGPGSGQLYARGSYRGNSGRSNGHARWWDSMQNIGQLPRGWRGPLTVTCGPESLWSKHNGAGYCAGANALREDIQLRHVSDGTSKTFLIGEHFSSDKIDRRTFWAYTYTSYNKSEVVANPYVLQSGNYARCQQFFGQHDCKRVFGSGHVDGGVQFAFVDGHVRLIARDTDLQAIASAGSIAGGESDAFE